jgi:hypothetical protein
VSDDISYQTLFRFLFQLQSSSAKPGLLLADSTSCFRPPVHTPSKRGFASIVYLASVDLPLYRSEVLAILPSAVKRYTPSTQGIWKPKIREIPMPNGELIMGTKNIYARASVFRRSHYPGNLTVPYGQVAQKRQPQKRRYTNSPLPFSTVRRFEK